MIADSLAIFAESQGSALGNILKTAINAQRKMDSSLNILANVTKESVASPIVEMYENGMHVLMLMCY